MGFEEEKEEESDHLLQKIMEDKTETLEIERLSEDDEPNKSLTWVKESKMMWEIAAPAILTTVAQFSVGFVTIAFVGHIGGLELAAVSVVQNVLEGFVYGIMVLHPTLFFFYVSICFSLQNYENTFSVPEQVIHNQS